MVIFGEQDYQGKCLKKKRSIKQLKDSHGGDVKALHNAASKSGKWAKDFHSEVLHFSEDSLPKLAEEGEAVGIITLEDVIEEILQVTSPRLFLYFPGLLFFDRYQNILMQSTDFVSAGGDL